MDPKFAAIVERLHPKLEALLTCTPHSGGGVLPLNAPSSAVYLFSEADEHLYVGRTNRLRARYREHCKTNHNDAPFAFKLAREASGHVQAKGGFSRSALQTHPSFVPAFEEQSRRVARMQFRWAEEADANRQCLLEIYATIALGARYNDFENH